MIILNKQPRLVIIQLIGEQGRNYDHQLMPGANKIPLDDWQRTVKGLGDEGSKPRMNPTLQHYLDEGLLDVPDEQPDEEGLNSLKISEACNLVRKTWSVPDLKEYLTQEQRPRVKAAIEKQIAQIEAKKNPSEDEAE